jgi:hypothetical protein
MVTQNKYGQDEPSKKFNQRALLPQLYKTTLGKNSKMQYRTNSVMNKANQENYQNP